MAEEELQKELDKLEIAPSTTQNFCVQPASMEGCSRSNNCRRCRFRRRSESTLDEYKSLSDFTDDSSWIRSTPRVQKLPLKKNTSTSIGANKKFVIRQPILRALRTCFHPLSSARRKLLTESASDKCSADNNHTNESFAGRGGITDFRDLIQECQILLEQDVEFSGRLNKRNSKFTTMQATTSAVSHISTEAHDKRDKSLVLQSSVVSHTSSPSPEHNATAPRASTSCSQQAGNGGANSSCDDVNIDELACYFDTFVHIPKKMSSMAEMMYI